MALIKQQNTYYVYFRDVGGKQRMRSLKTGNKEEAEMLHNQFMELLHVAKTKAMLAKNFPDQLPQVKSYVAETTRSKQISSASGLKVADMIEEVKKARDVPSQTIPLFDRFIKDTGIVYAAQATPKMCLDWLNKNFGDGNGKTYNTVKSSLNVLWRSTLVQSGLPASPWQAVPNRIVKAKNVESHRPLTEDEFWKAFNFCKEPYKTASLISWYTGLRYESCFRLSWSMINTKDNSITIMPGKTARFGRAVYIPIHPKLWNHLESLPRPDDDETPILSQWKKPRRCCQEERNRTYYAGVLHHLNICDNEDGKASFHSIRASFITRCDEAGISRKAIRGVVGHTSDQVTDLYSHDKETAKQILKLE